MTLTAEHRGSANQETKWVSKELNPYQSPSDPHEPKVNSGPPLSPVQGLSSASWSSMS